MATNGELNTVEAAIIIVVASTWDSADAKPYAFSLPLSLCGGVKRAKWDALRSAFKKAYGDEHILTFANLGTARFCMTVLHYR